MAWTLSDLATTATAAAVVAVAVTGERPVGWTNGEHQQTLVVSLS